MSTNATKLEKINEIISNHSTVLDVMNELKNELPFMNEETLYNFVVYSLKQNQHLSLIDNFINDLNENENINKETENIIQSIENDHELTPLRNVLLSHDAIPKNTS